LACFTAAIFGYHFLCRVSEYLVASNTKHHNNILARSVVFQVRGGLCLDTINGVVHVLSSDFHRYSKSALIGCSLTIKDSKMFHLGKVLAIIRIRGKLSAVLL
jgi:hypothetical protein